MDVPDPPYVPGAEAAGEVIHSAAHPVGAPVWCLPMTGALAEVLSVPESAVVPLPAGIDFPLRGGPRHRRPGGLDAGARARGASRRARPSSSLVRAARSARWPSRRPATATPGGSSPPRAAPTGASARSRAGADVALPTDAGLGDALREACGEGADLVIDILWGEPRWRRSAPCGAVAASCRSGSAAGQVAEVPAGPFRGGRLDLRGFSVFSEDPGDLAPAYPDLAEAAVRGAVAMSVVEVPFAEAAGRGRGSSSGAGGDKLVVMRRDGGVPGADGRGYGFDGARDPHRPADGRPGAASPQTPPWTSRCRSGSSTATG